MDEESNYPDEVEIFVRRFRPAVASNDAQSCGPGNGPYGFLARARGSYSPQSHGVSSSSRPKTGRVSYVETDFKRLIKGTAFHLPWSDTLVAVSLAVRITLGVAISDLGTAHVPMEVFKSGLKKVLLDVVDSGDVVGQLWVDIAYRQIVSGVDRATRLREDLLRGPLAGQDPSSGTQRKPDDLTVRSPRGAFRFGRLSRNIDWERLRSVDINKVIKYTDVSSVMSMAEMVKFGDTSDEDVDPKFKKALDVAQYLAQYLDAGKHMLAKKASVIEEGIRMFDEEEQSLDLELAKYRTRCKALRREFEDLDALEGKYTQLLEQLDPTWAQRVEPKRTPAFTVTMPKPDSISPVPKNVLADVSNVVVPKNEIVSPKVERAASMKVSNPTPSIKQVDLNPDLNSSKSQIASMQTVDIDVQVKPPIVLAAEIEIVPKVRVTTLVQSPVASSTIQSVDSLGGTGELFNKSAEVKVTQLNSETVREERVASEDFWKPAGVRKIIRAPLQVQVFNHDEDDIEDISDEVHAKSTLLVSDPLQLNVTSMIEERSSLELDEPTESSMNESQHPAALYVSESMVSEVSPPESQKPQPTNNIPPHRDQDVESKVEIMTDVSTAKSPQSTNRPLEDYSAPLDGSLDDESMHRAEAKQDYSPVMTSSKKDWKLSDKSSSKFSTDSRSLELHDELFGGSGGARAAESKSQAPSRLEGEENYSEDSYSQEDHSVAIYSYPPNANPNTSDLDSTTSTIPIAGLDQSLENFGLLDTGVIRQKMLKQSGVRASDDEDGVLFGTTSVNPASLDVDHSDHSKELDESLQVSNSQLESPGETSYGENSKPSYDSHEDIGAFIPALTAYEPPSPPALKNVDHEFPMPNGEVDKSAYSSVAESSAADISMEGLSKQFTEQYIEKALEQNNFLVEKQNQPEEVAVKTGGGGLASSSPPQTASKVSWIPGRAPMELIETAQAIDAYVSSIRLDGASLLKLGISKIYMRLSFMNSTSAASSVLNFNIRSSYFQMPVSFGAHIIFDRKGFQALSEEIQASKEDLSLQIAIFGATVAADGAMKKESVIGIAIVNLWYMIEDSCGIVMQEVDVTDAEGVGIVGAVVVDVRGHHALIDCSA